MKIKIGDKVKLKKEKILKGFEYLKDRIYVVKNLARRGNEIYAYLEPSLYVNIKSLEKIERR